MLGYIIISEKAHQNILLQRANAVKALIEKEKIGLRSGVICLVFSKDRSLQLYTLLDTYYQYVKNPAAVVVIYSASSDEHAQAYGELKSYYKFLNVNIEFVPEAKSFRHTLVEVLANIRVSSIFFLVDDIVFIRPLDLAIVTKIDPQQAVLSLRHSPHLKRSYTAGCKQLPPIFSSSVISSDLLEFEWFEKGHEWSDPWSVDGQVLSTAEVRVLTRISKFKAPNSYEAALKSFNDIVKGRKGICFKESKILNLPINRVQNENNNLSGEVSPDFLLMQWNKGLMIDTSVFDEHIPLAPHEEHKIVFRKRK
jgi:hypothetical protein